MQANGSLICRNADHSKSWQYHDIPQRSFFFFLFFCMSFNMRLVSFSGLNGWDLLLITICFATWRVWRCLRFLLLQINDTVDWSSLCRALTWFHWPCRPHSLSSSLWDSRGRSVAGWSRPLRPQWRRRSLQRSRLTGRNTGEIRYDRWPNMLINMWGVSRNGWSSCYTVTATLEKHISGFTFIGVEHI